LFHPDSARGISPFGAFSSPKVAAAFPQRLNPPAVSPGRSPAGEPAGRCTRHRLPGFDPCESPWLTTGCLGRRELVAPLGFSLPRHCHRANYRASTQAPLTRLAECSSANCSTTGTLGYQSTLDWPGLLPQRANAEDRTAFLGFPCRSIPEVRDARDLGLWFHLTGDRPSPASPTLIYRPSTHLDRSLPATD
jgi:hypothetical protein